MDNKQIKLLLTKKLDLTEIYVTGDSKHIKIIAIGKIFKGLSAVKRQQIVYAPLITMITQQNIHAISIFSHTNEEWEKIQNKQL